MKWETNQPYQIVVGVVILLSTDQPNYDPRRGMTWYDLVRADLFERTHCSIHAVLWII